MVVDTIDNIKINEEYASLLPQLSELEFQKLKESINTNGLWYPIIVNKDGIVLDGHHRFKACQELGIKEPKIETKEFADPLLENKFIIESNLDRRQLNDFQRIELALKLKPIFKEIAKKNMSLGGKGSKILEPFRDKGVNEDIAKIAGVSHETIRKVEVIKNAVAEEEQLQQQQQQPNLITSI